MLTPLQRFLYLGEGAYVFPIICGVILVVGIWIDLRRRIKPGHCERCGYNRTGNLSGICPECGKAIRQRPHPSCTRALISRLLAKTFLAALLALSFIAAYGFWVEVQTRPAGPSSLHQLYLPLCASIALLIGLVNVLARTQREGPWTLTTKVCLGIGILLNALNMMLGTLWR